jgi:putative GTP pyrophosphokinase
MAMNINKEYGDLKDDYDDFLKEVIRSVEKMIKDAKIPIASIYGRRKELDSIIEELTSERFRIKKSITELEDLVGLRIVLLFPEYKTKVIELLSHDFVVLKDTSLTPQDYATFGYRSDHLIVEVRDKWLEVPAWRTHQHKKIEIQIRTLSEHIWAETSHALYYKREENIPDAFKRDLSILSALLENVDEKLQNIKIKVEKHFKHIKECPYDEILTMDLHSETFRRVMLKNSNNIYDYNDYQNRELSTRIEKDYDILIVSALEELIAGKIDLENITTNAYVSKVIQILEKDKEEKYNKTNTGEGNE